MRNVEATYAAKGVATMEILVEGNTASPATDDDINRWAAQYQLAGDHRDRSVVRARQVRRRDRVPRVHGGARVDDARRVSAGRYAGGGADRAGARLVARAVTRAARARRRGWRSAAARRRRARSPRESAGLRRAGERLHAARSRRPAGAPAATTAARWCCSISGPPGACPAPPSCRSSRSSIEARKGDGFVVLGIAMDGPESVAQVVPFARRYNLTFPTLLDEETRVVNVYNPKRVAPMTVLIDRRGIIARVRNGYNAGDEKLVADDVANLLEVKTARRRARSASSAARGAARAIEFRLWNEPLRVGIVESFYAVVSRRSRARARQRDRRQRRADDEPALRRHPEPARTSTSAGGAFARSRASTPRPIPIARPARAAPTRPRRSTLRSRFCQNPFYVEKWGIEYNGRTVEAVLGDFYVSFGRGMVLSIRKIDELGIDTTLRGGKLVYHEDRVAATLVLGVTNMQNVDEATGRTVARLPARIDVSAAGAGAARLHRRRARRVSLLRSRQRRRCTRSAACRRIDATANTQRHDSFFLYGGSVDAPKLLRWLGVYFEGAGQLQTLSDARHSGYALYGALNGYFGNADVAARGQRLRAVSAVEGVGAGRLRRVRAGAISVATDGGARAHRAAGADLRRARAAAARRLARQRLAALVRELRVLRGSLGADVAARVPRSVRRRRAALESRAVALFSVGRISARVGRDAARRASAHRAHRVGRHAGAAARACRSRRRASCSFATSRS